MWINQGKPTSSENYRFLQQIRNIAIQFLGRFENEITNSAQKWPDIIYCEPRLRQDFSVKIHKSYLPNHHGKILAISI
jgi:hypothetical protein